MLTVQAEAKEDFLARLLRSPKCLQLRPVVFEKLALVILSAVVYAFGAMSRS